MFKIMEGAAAVSLLLELVQLEVGMGSFSLKGEDDPILAKGPRPYLGPRCTREGAAKSRGFPG